MQGLCVRFHYRGRLEYEEKEKEWQYIGGRSSMSIVPPFAKLSLAELKRHLADHISISEDDLKDTRLSWNLVHKGKKIRCSIDDNATVMSMARHVIRKDDGFVDIYATMPERTMVDSSEPEDDKVEQHLECQNEQAQHQDEQMAVEQQFQHQEGLVEQMAVEQQFQHQEGLVEQMAVEQQFQHQEGQLVEQMVVEQQFQHQEGLVEQMAVEQQFQHQEGQLVEEQRKLMKLPIVSAAMKEKGKGIKEEIAQEEDDAEDSSDSDYNDVHEVDSGDSSAEDDEAICYRKQALELKNAVKRRMLSEEEIKGTKVPEEFIVPENLKLEEHDESDCFDSEEELSYEEDSDGKVRSMKTRHRVYDPSAEVQEFEVGQAFHDSREFKQAVINYGLKNFKHIIFPKDERTRVLAKCSWLGCNWSIYGSLVPARSPWFRVSNYHNVHHCVPRRKNRLITANVIAEKYFREIKDNPGWRIQLMQEAVLEDLCADVSESMCKRAKRLVMERIVDGTNGEFARVYDYHLELVRSNPGSTVSVTLNPDVTDKPVFERMYVCLESCKRGFLAGCRRVVGLDGCFLKGAVKGQILCAIGRDPNNQMYPVAWATVEGENYDSWYWFLSLLQKDIQINNHGAGWVIISDQQKGLIRAVSEIIPEAEHRMCARHIYANWRKQHRDKAFQKLFWACAKSCDRIQFNYNRAKLAQKTPEGARDMMKTDPQHWCRANFRLGSYCDSVENNLCESFNNSIMRARFYPIISSMEIMRRKVMARIAENKAKSQGWSGTICPNIFKKLKLNIRRSNICRVLYNGVEGFEVEEGQHRRFTVNLETYTCSCRYWDLSGLPCCHAISAIYEVNRDLDDFIAPCYRIDVYDQVYSHVLHPVEGKESWPVAPNPRPFPPLKKKMPGRPKTERRREEQEKPKGNKLSRKGCIIRCSACGVEGHNKRKCTANPDVVRENAHAKKAAKRNRRKQEKASAKEATSSAQQQERHVLYVEKKRPKKKASEKQAAPPIKQANASMPSCNSQHQEQIPVHRPFVPQEKMQKKSCEAAGQSSSQVGSQEGARPRYQTIPMSEVVTESVPTHGRMKWYLWGDKGGEGQE